MIAQKEHDETVAVYDAMWPQRVKLASFALLTLFPDGLEGSVDRGTAIAKHPKRFRAINETMHVFDVDTKTWYPIQGISCPCGDTTSQDGWCKHRCALDIFGRAREYTEEQLLLDPATYGQVATQETMVNEETYNPTTGEIRGVVSLDEDIVDPGEDEWQREEATSALAEPCEVIETRQGRQSVPRRFIQTIHGVKTIQFAGLLWLAHRDGLLTCKATFVANEANLSVAQAVATFRDGREFADGGDSTKENGSRVKDHWRRLSLTRAKSRCLKDALGITLVSAEELDEHGTPAQEHQAPREHWCVLHNTQLEEKPSKREGETYWSHKKDSGGLCYGK